MLIEDPVIRAILPTAVRVAYTTVSLANHADDERTCYPSMATIAKETGTSRCNVMRIVPKLENKGLVSVEKRITSYGKSTHIYTMNMTMKKAKTPCRKLRHPDVSKCDIESSNLLDTIPW